MPEPRSQFGFDVMEQGHRHTTRRRYDCHGNTEERENSVDAIRKRISIMFVLSIQMLKCWYVTWCS